MDLLKHLAARPVGRASRRKERIGRTLLATTALLLLAACSPGRQKTARNAPSEGCATTAAPNPEATMARPWPADSVARLRGRIVIAHEVRSFVPEGDTTEFWIIDRSGALEREYDSITGGLKNGTPLEAELKLHYKGYSDEGFAADYAGIFEVVEVISVGKSAE